MAEPRFLYNTSPLESPSGDRWTCCIMTPSFAIRLMQLKTHREQVLSIIDQAVARLYDYFVAVEEVQCNLAQAVEDSLRTSRDSIGVVAGAVSLAGDPFFELDTEAMTGEVERYLSAGSSMIAQVPVIGTGLELIGQLRRRGLPILATRVMSVSQLEALYETCAGTPGPAPVYALFLQTAFSRYLSQLVRYGHAKLDAVQVLEAGRLLGGRLMQVCEQSGGLIRLLVCSHETEDAIAATYGPGPDQAIDAGNIREDREQTADTDREAWFKEAIPVYRRASLSRSIDPSEFLSFGPVEYVRGLWVDRTDDLLEVIRKRRHLQG